MRTTIRTIAYHASVAITAVLSWYANLAFADKGPLSIEPLLFRISYYILNPLITLGMVVALLYFMYGVVDFLRHRDSNATDASDGKNHLLYGLIGLFIMISAFAIMRVMSSILGGRVQTP